MQKEEFARRIGKRIRQLRKEKGMSQADLGLEVYKDKQVIGRWEAGQVNITAYNAYVLAKALGVTLAELYDVDELKR